MEEDEKRECTGDVGEEEEASEEGERVGKCVIMGGTKDAPPMWTTWWLSCGTNIVSLVLKGSRGTMLGSVGGWRL